MKRLLLRHPYPHWVLRMLPFAAVLLLVVTPLDRRGANILETAMATVTAVAFFSTAAITSTRALALGAAGIVAGWLVMGLPTLLPGAHPEAAKRLVLSRTPFLFMGWWWVALPCLVPLWLAWRRRGWEGAWRRWPDMLVALVGIHALWCTVACAFAQFPKIAYTQVREDLFPFAILFVLVVRAGRLARCTPSLAADLRATVPATLAILPLATVVAIGAMLLAHHGGWIGNYALEHRWIVREHLGGDHYLERLLFPFTNPNRLGYFLMLSGLAGVAAATFARSGWMRIVATSALMGCLLLTWTTLTRGALIAWGAAALVGVLMAAPRRKWQILGTLVLMAPIGFMLLPAANRQHLIDTVKIFQVRPDGENSMNARLALWQITVESIGKRPVAGLGYGTDSFEATMLRDHPDVVRELKGTSHAHNVLLEVAVESGLPAAGTLLAMTAVLLAGLVAAYRAAPPRDATTKSLAIGLALVTAIIVYGLANYPLRRALGHHTVYMVALLVAMAEWMQSRRARKRAAVAPP